MDSHVWRRVYPLVRKADRTLPRTGRRKTYSDALIVGMYLWSVGHDRPLCWACDRLHYTSLFRPRKLPSVSQFSRRIRTPRCQAILQALHDELARVDEDMPLSFIDGRPFVVGSCSKDRQARPGRIYGGFARGYKLHAIVTEDGRTPMWAVTPLNTAETKVAEILVDHAKPSGLVLGDANYDSGKLYDRIAACGGRLLTPLPKNAGCGHRRQSPTRLEAVTAWKGIAGYVYRDRLAVERTFGQQTSFGGGLGPLPPWVRTLPRVCRWIGAKLIIYHARLELRKAAG